MSCPTCQTKFSFFTRENGCPNCGFSYCSKCLKYKCNLPTGQAKKVCGPCYNKLTMAAKSSSVESTTPEMPSPDASEGLLAPVDIAKKLDDLENPGKPPIVIYKPAGNWDRFKAGLEPADQEIVDRLKKLKDGDHQRPAPSIEEIRKRLAILKDQDPESSQQSVNIYQTDTRTDQQKEDDLIRQYLESLELSSGSDPTKDVEARLNALKGFDPSKQYSSISTENVDEATATKRIIEKALAEAALEAKYGDGENDDSDKLESPESPGEMDVESESEISGDDEDDCCAICDELTGLVKCPACDGIVFCEKCFKSNHLEIDDECEHKSVPLKRKKTSKCD